MLFLFGLLLLLLLLARVVLFRFSAEKIEEALVFFLLLSRFINSRRMVVCLWSNVRFRGFVFGRTLRVFFCHRVRVRRFFIIVSQLGRYYGVLDIDALYDFSH